MNDNFALLRADISRLDTKVEAVRSEISSLKNALVVCACGIIAALIGSSAF